MNAGYMQEYQDMVNTVDQEFDNTQIADMMNLTEAEITRMDNADKLYELNMRNPNYYFNPQKHSTIFQNAEALEAFKNKRAEGIMSFQDAYDICITEMGFKRGTNEANTCAKNLSGGKNAPSNNEKEEEDERYGGPIMKSGGSVPCKTCNNKGTIREKDLIESKIKLRNWIMGD